MHDAIACKGVLCLGRKKEGWKNGKDRKQQEERRKKESQFQRSNMTFNIQIGLLSGLH